MSAGERSTGRPAGTGSFAVDDDRALQASSLLRSVTHDLRTPLAAIRAIVTDLHDGPDYDDETREDLLQTVCDEVDRLDRLVGNLLSMSRIEAGALTPERQAIDVSELVRHRLRALAPLLRDHEVVETTAPGLPFADGDYAQLEEVLTNLLGNAVRHAPDGTTIAVGATTFVSTEGAGGVRVAIVDHGPGIPANLRAELMRPFARGPGSRSTGLGLAISDAIVRANGGELVIGDTPGGGATVSFTLPIHLGPPPFEHDDASEVER